MRNTYSADFGERPPHPGHLRALAPASIAQARVPILQNAYAGWGSCTEPDLLHPCSPLGSGVAEKACPSPMARGTAATTSDTGRKTAQYTFFTAHVGHAKKGRRSRVLWPFFRCPLYSAGSWSQRRTEESLTPSMRAASRRLISPSRMRARIAPHRLGGRAPRGLPRAFPSSRARSRPAFTRSDRMPRSSCARPP